MLSGFKGSRNISSLSLFFIPVKRFGDQGPYFPTEKSDLAKVAWGIGSRNSSPAFSSARAAPPTSKEQSSSCSLSPEGRENVKGYQDSSCRAQTHYQLGLTIKKKKKNPLQCYTTIQLWASPRLEAVDIVHNQDSKPSLDEDVVCILSVGWSWSQSGENK